tara:strand:+ start:3403 stop:3828 length:426 start_codon:yes stop_codon:yes gene_type:complete
MLSVDDIEPIDSSEPVDAMLSMEPMEPTLKSDVALATDPNESKLTIEATERTLNTLHTLHIFDVFSALTPFVNCAFVIVGGGCSLGALEASMGIDFTSVGIVSFENPIFVVEGSIGPCPMNQNTTPFYIISCYITALLYTL